MAVQKDGFCSLCVSHCAARYTIDEGRMIKAEPLPEHPTGGAMCLKGKAAPEIIYSPDRILTPMRRTNPKGHPDPGWESISWEEALSITAERLNSLRSAYGAESVSFATATSSGTGLADSVDWINRLVRVFGTPNNVNAVELCDFHKEFSHAFTYGTAIPYPEYQNSDTIVLWGFNPTSTWLNNAEKVGDAKTHGAKILVVDPRASGFAKTASQWLRIRPGADGILALAVARYMLNERLYNEQFVRRYTTATLLVRHDTGRYLRAGELIQASLSPGDYVAWNRATACPSTYSADRRIFKSIESELALEGEYLIKLKDGKSVSCKPAFQLYRDLVEPFSFAYAAEHSWLEENEVAEFARHIADAEKLSYYVWTGVSQHAHATQIDRAIATLMSLKGCYDAPGGNVVLSTASHNAVGELDLLPEGMLEKTLGFEELPLGPPRHGMVTGRHFYNAVLDDNPYRIRGLVGFGANLAVAHSGTARAQSALKKLEFYVHIDMTVNPTARYADIFLPANSIWEHEGLRVGFSADQKTQEFIQLRQQMVSVRGDTKSDVEICFALAKALGHGDEFFDGNIENGYDFLLEPTGLTVDQLRRNPEGVGFPLNPEYYKYRKVKGEGIAGFPTETGLVELYSEQFIRNGQHPLPHLGPWDLPGGSDKPDYPFALTTAKSGYFCHSQHRNIPSLRQREPDPVVELSPAAAESMALTEGEWVYLETETGRVKMRLKVVDTLHDSVARGSYGWWQPNSELGLPGYDPFSREGSNYNVLVNSMRFDPVSGTPANRSTSCRIFPVENPDRKVPAWGGFRRSRIASITPVTHDVREIIVEPLGDGPLPDFLPGQHLPFKVRQSDGSEVLRFYSLTCSAVIKDRRYYSISVRRVPAPPDSNFPPGKMSGFIHDELSVDDIVYIKPPQGTFHFPLTGERPLIFVAGGIGITPFLCYIRTAVALGLNPRVHLAYGNRSAMSHAFRDELADLAGKMDRLTVADVYSAGEPEDVRTYGCRIGRLGVGDVLPEELVNARPLVFQCGPPVLMSAVHEALVHAGMPDGDVIEEAFTAPAAVSDPLPDGPFQVSFKQHDLIATWTLADGSLLDFGEKADVPLKSGCRVGQCESCAVTVRSGSFMYKVKIDRPDDGKCLLCQAVPTSDLELDV